MDSEIPVDSPASNDGSSARPAAAWEQAGGPGSAPVDIRSASLLLLVALVSLYALHWAQAVFIPLLLGLMSSYALAPLVDRLERARIPRVLTSALLLMGIVGGLGWTAHKLSDDAKELIATLPEVAQKLRRAIEKAERSRSKPVSSLDQVQQAAAELEKSAEAGAVSAGQAPRGVTRVQIEKPRFSVQDYFWAGTIGLAALAAQATVVLFLTFFLLTSGSSFRRKLVRIAGPTLSEKKLTLEALHEITQQIQRYLLVQVLTSVIVGLATWLSFLWMGVQHAAVWGVIAAILNLVPYLGSVVFTAASAAFALLQFGTLESAALVAGVSLVLHTVSGYGLTPWLTSRTSRLNAVTVFAGVLAWGWLWGLWGLLLGVPILMAVKAACDRIDHFKPIGELMGS